MSKYPVMAGIYEPVVGTVSYFWLLGHCAQGRNVYMISDEISSAGDRPSSEVVGIWEFSMRRSRLCWDGSVLGSCAQLGSHAGHARHAVVLV